MMCWSLRECQRKVEMSYSPQSRNVRFWPRLNEVTVTSFTHFARGPTAGKAYSTATSRIGKFSTAIENRPVAAKHRARPPKITSDPYNLDSQTLQRRTLTALWNEIPN